MTKPATCGFADSVSSPRHAVVADLRRRHRDDLAGVGGIGQDLLVAGHARVEDDLTLRLARARRPRFHETRSIFEREHRVHSSLRPFERRGDARAAPCLHLGRRRPQVESRNLQHDPMLARREVFDRQRRHPDRAPVDGHLGGRGPRVYEQRSRRRRGRWRLFPAGSLSNRRRRSGSPTRLARGPARPVLRSRWLLAIRTLRRHSGRFSGPRRRSGRRRSRAAC